MEWLSPVIDEVVKVVGTLLAGLIAALVIQGLRKLGLSIDADRAAKIEYFAQQAVLTVEEKAAAYLKQQAAAMKPEQKLHEAMVVLMQRFPKLSAEDAQRIVTAALPKVGLGAAMGKAPGTPQ